MSNPPKPKTCKAPGCEVRFIPTYNTTQSTCCPLCAIALTNYKNQVKREKQTRKELAELNSQSLSWQHKQTQPVVNKYIRLRDHDQPCISCGTTRAKWDAGHYRSVGSSPHLRYNTDNIFKQCFSCNQPKGGSPIKMRQGMIARIGEVRVEAIESDEGPRQYRVADVKAIREEFRQKTKKLKADLSAQADSI